MIKKNMMVTVAIAVLACRSLADANMDADVDMEASQKVADMFNDMGSYGESENNGKVLPCLYRGTKKVSITHHGETTTYSGEYLNCRENGRIRDGIYTVIAVGKNIYDSQTKRTKNGELFDAAAAGDSDSVRKLISKKADVNYTESVRIKDGGYIDEWSPLMSSVVTRNLEIMKMLVAAGAWVNYMNSTAANALWIAASNGQLDMVRFLAGKKGNLNNMNYEDNSPLMAAVIGGHDTVVEYLVGLKVELYNFNKNGDNALMLALEGGHSAIARRLIDAGADLNHANRSGATALMIAVVEGDEETVRMLLKYGADPTVKSGTGKTAFEYAHLKGNPAIIELLQTSSAARP